MRWWRGWPNALWWLMRARLALWQLNSNNGIRRDIGWMYCVQVSACFQACISLSLPKDNEIYKSIKPFTFSGLRVISLSFPKIFGKSVLLCAQKCGAVFAKRIEPDVFGWDEALVTGGLLAPACSTSDVSPVGSLVTGAFMLLIFDKGFQQNGLETIAMTGERPARAFSSFWVFPARACRP